MPEVRTRTITVDEYKCFILRMNPMRGRAEDIKIIIASLERERVVNFYNEQLVEPYTEEGSPSFPVHGDKYLWRKTFKKGGPLEWFNPIDLNKVDHAFGHGISEEWAQLRDIDAFIQRNKTVLI